jgi:uncharacterized protein YecT (DUF1311 family)
MKLQHIAVALTAFLSSSVTIAASFNCQSASSPLEQAICANPKLGDADEKMALAYKEALSAARGLWKADITKQQRKWLSYIADNYKKQISSKTAAGSESADELVEQFLNRATQLHKYSEREKIILIGKTPEAEGVCNKILDKRNMTWDGRSDYGHDSYTLKLPAGFTNPNWTALPSSGANHAKFDFLNRGEASDVFEIEVQTSHFEYHWYIVAAKDEAKTIRQRVDTFRDGENSFANDLQVEFPEGVDDGSPNAANKKHANPKLASRLFDTSATKLYRGWYTRSQATRYNHKTYILAESVNNLGGPTFAVFRPTSPGSLAPLCYFRANPSIVVNSTKQLDKDFKCPAEFRKLESALDETPCGQNSAQITLKEWGGTRPVVQENGNTGLCGDIRIKVGNVGEKSVNKNSWPPIDGLEDGQGALFLTPSGPYIVVNSYDVDMYYRIIDNRIKKVCAVERKTIPPVGYRRNAPQP